MSSADATSLPDFEPPGPGPWEQDPVHFPRARDALLDGDASGSVQAGHGDFARYYGLLLDGLEMAYVNGFAYSQRRARAGEPRSRSASSAREEVLDGKLWREQLREWDETVKPAAIAAHRELQAVDPDALSRRRAGRVPDALPRPPRGDDRPAHALHGVSAVIPTGDFLAHVGDWTGLPPAELLGLMRGASPVSAGASSELERMIAAIARTTSCAGAPRVGRRSCAACSTPCARSRARRAQPCPRISTSSGNRLLDGFDICGALRARDARRAAPRDPDGGRRRGARTTESRRGGRRRPRPRCRPSIGRSSTSCSARRG